MTSLINSVADLTDLLDRDELEITLASVLFDLIGPVRLALWRLVPHQGELRLRQLALGVAGKQAAAAEAPIAIDDLLPLTAHAGLHACVESRLPQQLPPDDEGCSRHVFPVMSAREVVGLVELHHRRALSAYQKRLVIGLLRIYRNHLRILDASEYDELTGLLNRKTFDDYFRRQVVGELAHGTCHANPDRVDRRGPRNLDGRAWLAVVDIDFFKRINDRFGHLYGDEVLVLVARLMRNVFRYSDRIFRFGGEEFVIVFRPTTAGDAGEILERCRAAVEAFAFPQVGRVTVSIGYTTIAAGDSGSDAFGRADQALYVAKQRGRNQVHCYEHLVREGLLQRKVRTTSDLELFAPDPAAA